MTSISPSYLGKIESVSGGNIHIHLTETVASGLVIIGGKTYKVGQVGSYIKIPQGYQSVYGVISDVGAEAVPQTQNLERYTGRWIKAQLVGEAHGKYFERGISQFPNVGDAAHIVTEDDLKILFSEDKNHYVPIGRLSNAEAILAKIDINKLITRHSAVLGSTGSGKSTTVTSLLRRIVDANYNNSRILLFDIHGEYASALSDVAKIYSSEDIPDVETHRLHIPYWAVNSNVVINALFGSLNDNQKIAISDKITSYKIGSLSHGTYNGVTENIVTIDTPLPYSLKKLWYELADFEETTYKTNALEVPSDRISDGDRENFIAPKYPPVAPAGSAPFSNRLALGLKKQLNHFKSRMLDHRYDFIFKPGNWEPDSDGAIEKDLDALLNDWIGHEKQITILDFSAIPSDILTDVIGNVLNILYESIYWGRNLPEGGRERPLLIVMEEAHKYLDKDVGNFSLDMTKKIVKEGRKYGIGCMIVSQRPSEINETILSQCGTFVTLRLSNATDRGKIKNTLPDSLGGILDVLPSLRTGEVVITGEAATIPIRCRMFLPEENKRPNSFDPDVSLSWAKSRLTENYAPLLAKWRAQNSNYIQPESTDNESNTATSS